MTRTKRVVMLGLLVAETAVLLTGTAQPSAAAIAAGGAYHTVVLKTTDGTVWTWGYNSNGQLGYSGSSSLPAQVPGLTGVVAVAAGATHTLALKSDGTVWAWGNNSNG